MPALTRQKKELRTESADSLPVMSSNVEVLPGGGGEKRRSRARGVAKAMGSIAVAAARGSAKGVAVIGSKVSSSRKGVQKISAGDDPNAPPMAVRFYCPCPSIRPSTHSPCLLSRKTHILFACRADDP